MCCGGDKTKKEKINFVIFGGFEWAAASLNEYNLMMIYEKNFLHVLSSLLLLLILKLYFKIRKNKIFK